jgi:hypothetical protein
MESKMKRVLFTTVFLAGVLRAQDPTQHPVVSFNELRFLEGTWEAKTPASAAGPEVTGKYSFRKELGGHILARHSDSDGCKGPADFDCDHHDLLYVYQDAPGQPLKAVYFDNEGHTIHYDVFRPTATQVVFLTDPSAPGPRLRLVYDLDRRIMSGKFQMLAPGQSEWRSYLEWSGGAGK